MPSLGTFREAVPLKALVVGASAGLGRALSEALASRGCALLLVARDARDLERQALHLRTMYGVQVDSVAADAAQPEKFLNSLMTAAETFGEIQGLFFPIGFSNNDDRGTLPFFELQRLVNVNLLIVMAVVGYFLPKLQKADYGYIVGFGSVAAVRGRSSNVVYAAAKRGLTSYFESLRHLNAKSNVRVQFYQLGYIATQQSFGRRLLFPPGSPEEIAAAVIRNLDRDQPMRFLPRYWALIAFFVCVLPWIFFRRLNV
jgi:short-subunit dehydrogenase